MYKQRYFSVENWYLFGIHEINIKIYTIFINIISEVKADNLNFCYFFFL